MKLFPRSWTLALLVVLSCSPVDSRPEGDGRIIGADGAQRYESLTDEEKSGAAALKVWFEHASVGGNILDGVDALIDQGLVLDRTGMSTDAPLTSEQAQEIAVWYSSHTGVYDNMQGNPGLSEKIRYFREDLLLLADHLDVAFMKFCYIDDESDAGTAGVENYIQAMETLQETYPQVVFVYVTMPVKTSGSHQATLFNQVLRDHCRQQNLWLYDLADVESRLEDGTTRIINGEEALRTDLAVNTDGDDHLNRAGQVRGAKALITLLADLAQN